MTTASQTKDPPVPTHPAHGLTMKYMLLVGGAVVSIFLVLRLMLEHRRDEKPANAVA